MYTVINFKTKKALKQAVKDGKSVAVFQPGLGESPTDGVISLEGPHYPELHRWYASATLAGGMVVSVK